MVVAAVVDDPSRQVDLAVAAHEHPQARTVAHVVSLEPSGHAHVASGHDEIWPPEHVPLDRHQVIGRDAPGLGRELRREVDEVVFDTPWRSNGAARVGNGWVGDAGSPGPVDAGTGVLRSATPARR